MGKKDKLIEKLQSNPKPHPHKELKEYQAKGLLEHLAEEGLI